MRPPLRLVLLLAPWLLSANSLSAPGSALVLLNAQADLSGASALSTRAAKARFVYDRLRATARTTQAPLLAWLKAQALTFHSIYLINAVELDGVSAAQLPAIAARPEVKLVIPNPLVRAQLAWPGHSDLPRALEGGVEPGIARTGAPTAWNAFGARGQGVVVGGNDTGVDWSHPALVRSYRGASSPGGVDHSLSWHDAIRKPLLDGANTCGYDVSAPCDDLGHGTHTLGTMVGDDGAGNRIGMAPGAKWIACRSMDRGAGTPASYLECFEFFLAPYPQGHDSLSEGHPELGADIVNNSWGCAEKEGCIAEDFQPAFDALAAAGVLVVAAAGNSGPGCGTSADGIGRFGGGARLVAGAIDASADPEAGTIASFSSRGPFPDGALSPDLLAPGVGIRSSTSGGGYSSPGWDGTSMAAPHAAGAAALVLSARPALSGQPHAVADLLRRGALAVADPAGCGGLAPGASPNDAAGFGELNVVRALQLAFGLALTH